ncbi:unnamed protein product, partial [Meganyctiphanes norvegica]
SILLKMMTAWIAYRNKVDGGEDSNDIKSVTTRMNVLFSLTEDLSQMTLQIIFFLGIDHNYAEGIVDQASWFSVVISCFSLSKNYAEYHSMNPNSSPSSGLLILTTTFIAAGGRVLLCCLIALPTQKRNVFLPVFAAVVMHITLALLQFCVGFCRKFIIQKWLCSKKNIESSEIIDMNYHIKPNQQFSDFTFSEIPQRSTNGKDNYEKILNLACKLAAGLRSLLFSVTVDGHSHLGLWSSAWYATLALWFRLLLLVDDADIQHFSQIALTFAMLSFTINTIVVLINGQNRKISLVVSVLFMIFPTYICIVIATQNKELYGKILWHNDDNRIFQDAIDILIPITTVAGLVILVNIAAIAKALKTEKDKKNRKDYLLQKMRLCNSNNETKNKNHTI